MKRIGLFGGTFDPPHLAHIRIAQIAYERLDLCKVFFIPCKQSPHKEELMPLAPNERLKMISIATDDHEWARISDVELLREGLSYSIDTVEYFRDQYPDAKLFWVMGSDQWKVFDTWYRANDLAGIVEFIVFPRPELPRPQPGKQLHVIDEKIDISSSQIRERLARGDDVSASLHPEVESYIRANGLYV